MWYNIFIVEYNNSKGDEFMGVNRILVYDDMDGFYDCYFFNNYVDDKEVEKVILEVKKRLEGEWTLDDIREEIKKKFNVKEVVLFDNTGFGSCSTIEVNNLGRE